MHDLVKPGEKVITSTNLDPFAIVRRMGVVEAVNAHGFRLAQEKRCWIILSKNDATPEWREDEVTMVLRWRDIDSLVVVN